jgi:hypothetical protein
MSLEGSCHCGAIRFRVNAVISELTTCDCSLCAKRNAVMAKIAEHALIMVTGEELLTLYQWNTRKAKHYFCRQCGIYVFHRKRAAPDHFGVNAFCLHDFDVKSMPVRPTQGANMTVEDPFARPDWPGPRSV